jgi:hypothetical protein
MSSLAPVGWITPAGVSNAVVIVISPLGIDYRVSRFTVGTVRGHYRIPVIVESGRLRNVCRRTWAGVIGGEP